MNTLNRQTTATTIRKGIKTIGYYVNCFLVCAFIIGMLLVSGYLDTHYTFKGSVVEIEDDLVVVEDFGGDLWEVYADGYQVGDNVKVYVDDNGTSTYNDDEIVDLKRLDN